MKQDRSPDVEAMQDRDSPEYPAESDRPQDVHRRQNLVREFVHAETA